MLFRPFNGLFEPLSVKHNSMDDRKRQVKQADFQAECVSVRLEGMYGEAVGMLRAPKITTRKISKNEYVYLPTGEIREYSFSGEKGGESLRKTMKRLEGLIRTNFSSGDESQVFMTLTYKENMQDNKKLYDDFEKFWKRLVYKMSPRKLEYLSVAEPQGRGAWHLHVLVKAEDGNALYIDNKKLTEIWGHGATDCQRLKGDDCGAYYATYFTTIQSAKDDIAEKGNRSKKQEKTSRLKYYPVNFKFYRHSRGIKEPEKVEMSRIEFEENYPVLICKNSYDIIDEQEKVLNRIEKQLRRKNAHNAHFERSHD